MLDKNINSEWIIINGNKIHKTCIISDNVEMGTGNIIYPFTTIGLVGFIRNSDEYCGKVFIGNNNRIGANTSIMAGLNGSTIIGDNNIIMNYVNVGHDAKIGFDNEIGAGSIIAGWVTIGNKNQVKIGCTFRNRVSIGDSNIIGMGSLIVSSFSDNNLVYGSPAKEVKKVRSSCE